MPALVRSRGPERADRVSPAGVGEERGHDVGGVPIERDSRPVVAHWWCEDQRGSRLLGRHEGGRRRRAQR
jgi:hypothetical protein